MKSASAKLIWSNERSVPSHCSVLDASRLALARMAVSSEVCSVSPC